MKTLLLLLTVPALMYCACTACPSTDPNCNAPLGGGGGDGGGSGGGGGMLSRYTVTTLDPAVSDTTYLDAVFDNDNGRVGVAYFVGSAVGLDAGIVAPWFSVRYVEWNNGTVGTPEIADMVQNRDGIAVAFNPVSHEPAIAYLGGGNEEMSLYWLQTDAEINFRSAGTWTKDTAARNSMDIMCPMPNAVSNVDGPILGLFPGIGFDSMGVTYFCFRDVHNGQFPQQDWAGSDVKCVYGHPGAWTGECTNPGGVNKQGWGGRIRMIMVNDQPFISYDQALGGSDTLGINTVIQQRNKTTGWDNYYQLLQVANTGTGSSPAYDTMVGYGIAVTDYNTGVLSYVDKSPTATVWNMPDQVYGTGTGGLYPTLAFDPTYHEPAIAFFNCSLNIGAQDNNCQVDHQQVQIAQRIMGNWQTDTVTTDHWTRLRLGFVNGKRALVFRDYKDGSVKIAVEN
jgi:hypothetical protein